MGHDIEMIRRDTADAAVDRYQQLVSQGLCRDYARRTAVRIAASAPMAPQWTTNPPRIKEMAQ